MSIKITKDNFTIKDFKFVAEFNNICSGLKSKDNFEDRFIYLYKKLFSNYDHLKKLLVIISDIYQEKIDDGFDESSLKEFIDPENINFIKRCIIEHDEFSVQMNKILKVNASYNKTTIKEKADLYIKKIIPIFEENGVLAALEQIIFVDQLSLPVLCNENFDNLVYYALVRDKSMLKNSNILLRDLFSLSKILICYDILINKVNLNNTYSNLFGNDEDKIIALSNMARHLNGLKPTELSRILTNEGIIGEELKDNMKIYIDFYDKREKEIKEKRDNDLLSKLENELDKCSEIVMRFVNSKFTDLDNYITVNRIYKRKFDKALQVLKDNNHPTYELYCHKVNMVSESIDLVSIIEHMKSGILVNGEKVRDFDLVDYYSMTSVSTSEAKRLAHKASVNNEISYTDYLLVSNFHKKYDNDRVITEANKSSFLDVNLSFSINGSMYNASDDDKKSTLLYLYDNNILLTCYTYKIMLKRYIMEKFAKEKAKQKTIDNQ